MSKLKINNVVKLTNKEILALAKSDPTYNSWTSKLTNDIFTEKGYEELKQNDYKILSDFFGLSVRVILNQIKTANPHIPSLYTAIVEEYANEQGGIFQRVNTKLLKPTSPKYRELVSGGSIDPFIVRKPNTDERFFKQNFDFQNFLTIQDIELKKMFLDETGMSEYIAGIMKSLDESYAIQKYQVFREMISKAINSTQNPLKDTQKIGLAEVISGDEDTQKAFIQAMQNLAVLFDTSVVSKDFNAKSFEHGLYKDDYVLVVRSDIYNYIKTELMANTYHTENLGIPFQIELVKDFGGITYTDKSGVAATPLYDEFGAVKGFSTDGTTLIDENDLIKVDPNEDVMSLLMQKGCIFATQQQPYETRTIYNPAGLYTNFWASQPNGAFNYDACYDIIEFVKTTG